MADGLCCRRSRHCRNRAITDKLPSIAHRPHPATKRIVTESLSSFETPKSKPTKPMPHVAIKRNPRIVSTQPIRGVSFLFGMALRASIALPAIHQNGRHRKGKVMERQIRKSMATGFHSILSAERMIYGNWISMPGKLSAAVASKEKLGLVGNNPHSRPPSPAQARKEDECPMHIRSSILRARGVERTIQARLPEASRQTESY